MRQRLDIAQAIAGDPKLVIVEEPTAGLDPEERLRFYHLLTELAEDRTVLLSTHIVDDVAVLCPQFAVIRGGRLVARTTPRAARAALQGRIFEGLVTPADLPELRATRAVTQTLLVEGRHRVRLYEADGIAVYYDARHPYNADEMLAALSASRRWYGEWFALWMLHQFLGREASFAALRAYIEKYRDTRDHAAVEDYLAIMRRHAADTPAFDAFASQWFQQVVVPEYKIDEATVAKHGDRWTVTARVGNLGTATMPVEIAGARGVRFPHEKKSTERYMDARTRITLGPKEAKTVTIACTFEPERVIVDPDVTVLMLERQKAEVKLKSGGDRVAMR